GFSKGKEEIGYWKYGLGIKGRQMCGISLNMRSSLEFWDSFVCGSVPDKAWDFALARFSLKARLDVCIFKRKFPNTASPSSEKVNKCR
ncbi:hypothetical protein J6590_100055, partial [Homalodisca vitripennis]